jgi:hypothetical protein
MLILFFLSFFFINLHFDYIIIYKAEIDFCNNKNMLLLQVKKKFIVNPVDSPLYQNSRRLKTAAAGEWNGDVCGAH